MSTPERLDVVVISGGRDAHHFVDDVTAAELKPARIASGFHLLGDEPMAAVDVDLQRPSRRFLSYEGHDQHPQEGPCIWIESM